MISPMDKSRSRRAVITLLTLLALVVTLAPRSVKAAIGVSLTLHSPPNQSVGTPITWLAIPEVASNTLVYQFSIAAVGDQYQVVRDYNIYGALQWAPIEEGSYEIRVVVKDRATGESATATTLYTVLPVVNNNDRAVTSTNNPLVALYSRPSCESGYVRVRYRAQFSLDWQYTNWRVCRPEKTVNFYLAGMRANTTYVMQDEWAAESGVQRSVSITHTSGTPPVTFPIITTVNPVDANTSLRDDILLVSPLYGDDQSTFPFATDLWGRVIWYYPNLGNSWQLGAYLLRPIYGGTMMLIVNYLERVQGLREIDLAGNTVRETNTTAISDQLVALGHDPIIGFHHDAVRLANGRTLILANVERIVEDVQGAGPVNILGDVILELDQNWQVTWVWNSFEQLDLQRAAVLGETCASGNWCPEMNLGEYANDWTHSNTIEYIPSDGNLLVSMRHQDWVIKIDYQNGAGSGAVLWRLGKDGDFQFISDDPYPWFSHQHYSRFVTPDTLLLVDNGNTRCTILPPPCHSRGQVLKLDEANRTATLELNADLNPYAIAWGSSNRLTNGNYHFNYGTGWPVRTQALEVDSNGTPVFRLVINAALYRSFRLSNLHIPEVNYVVASTAADVAHLPLWELPGSDGMDASPIYLPYMSAGTE